MLPLEQKPSIENDDDTAHLDTDSVDQPIWAKVNSLSFIQNNREQLVTLQVNFTTQNRIYRV